MPNTAEERKKFLSDSLIWMNVVATADNSKTKATINNCPASRPKLNANNGGIRFSSAPSSDLSRKENPSP